LLQIPLVLTKLAWMLQFYRKASGITTSMKSMFTCLQYRAIQEMSSKVIYK